MTIAKTVDISAYDSIKCAVLLGIPVYWKQTNYVVEFDKKADRFHVRCTNNNNIIGLHGLPAGEGKVWNTHDPEDFIIHSHDFMTMLSLYKEQEDSGDIFGSAMGWLFQQCSWMTEHGIFIPPEIGFQLGVNFDHDEWYGLDEANAIGEKYQWSEHAHDVFTKLATYLQDVIEEQIGLGNSY